MLGLNAREHEVNPHTTIEKFWFLLENAATHEHRPTTFVSFGSLFILVLLRNLKHTRFVQRYWFIHRIPEVLIVVIVSTSKNSLLIMYPGLSQPHLVYSTQRQTSLG